MIYRIHNKCRSNIVRFYKGVAKKYKYTYSEELMLKNIDDATNWHMANTDKWYYAYTIDGDTITIQDACHAQNMHD